MSSESREGGSAMRALYLRPCYCHRGAIGDCITCLAWHRVLRRVMARRAWRIAA